MGKLLNIRIFGWTSIKALKYYRTAGLKPNQPQVNGEF